VAGPWGDSAFQAELGGLRAARSFWSALRLAAQVLLVALPLAGVLLLWRLGERLPIPEPLAIPASPTPVEKGIRWLEVRPEFRRRARKMLMALSAGMWARRYPHRGSPRIAPAGISRAMVLLPAVIVVIAALAPLALLVWMPRAWRMRLGTDGRRFFFDPGNGKVEEHEFSELAISNGQQLLIGRKLIALRLAPGALFAEEELRGTILARIPPSGRVNAVRLFARALGRGSRELWAVLIIVVIGTALLLLPKLFPAMAPYLKAIAAQLLGPK